jgi:hypothetical protein
MVFSRLFLRSSQQLADTERAVRAAEGRTAHYNGWKRANTSNNVFDTIPQFRSSHYHEPVLPN